MSDLGSRPSDASARAPYVLAFDTANEIIAIGLGVLHAETRTVEVEASIEAEARRASNTQLLPRIDAALAERGVARADIACVVVGRGPGSFTGVRIAMATAKGVASALDVPLIGVSTLDAVAWGAWQAGVHGPVAVVADAMRKEVYPVRYQLGEVGVERLEADRVVKAEAAAAELAADVFPSGSAGQNSVAQTVLASLRNSLGEPRPADPAECSQPPVSQLTGDALEGVVPPARPADPAECSQSPVPQLAGDALRGTAAGSDPTGGVYPILQLAGDALKKYGELFAGCGVAVDESLWTPTGRGLLLALQDAWRSGLVDPFDGHRHDPAFALPVYTRLSDAEENERIRLAKNDPKNLATGVQDVAVRRDQRASMHDTAILNARPDARGITYKPLDAAHASQVAALETQVMGSDAWNEALVADELPRPDRSWWAAYGDEALVGYAGGWIVDGQVQILKVGVDPAWRRFGIARELLARVAADARDLGASSCSLEVRAGNAGAQAFYEALGFEALGTRPRYYSDGEDALILQGPLPLAQHDVAGMQLQVDAARASAKAAATAASAACATSPAATSTADPATCAADSASCTADSAVHAADPAALNSAGTNVSRETFHDKNSQEYTAARHGGDVSQAAKIARPLILAIESSCDETAAAIVDGEGNLVSDVVASQIDFHARFGGVVPEIASRKHIEALCGVCDECFDVAAAHVNVPQLTWGDLDAVAVTYAPGLVGALVVGVAFAKGAAWGADVPFIGVHHLEGHLYANKIGAPDFAPPAVVSLVSGGNTLLVHMKDWGDYETLGATIDDAVGEAFDKVAKALGLGYPGGPVISKQAALGDPKAIPFPRAMMHSGDLRFSLSGLKTAVVTYINNERAAGRELNVPDIAASFQQAVVDVQVKKAQMALKQTGARTFCLGGGVAANPVLRAAYEQLCKRLRVRLVMPPLSACGDNAGMIALVALDRYRQQRFFGLDADAQAHANLDEPY